MPNNLTQVAGSYVGTVDETILKRRNARPNVVLIADGQNDTILGHINYKYLLSNNHQRSKKDNLELFDFITFADKSFSPHLTKRNRIIINGEDGELREFIVFESNVNRIDKQMELYTSASYLELKKSKVIRPHKTTSESAEWHVQTALSGTEWQVGNITFKGIRTLTFENYTNPFGYLKRIASEFGLELDFRIEHNGSKITGRYVDLIEQVGTWRGRTVEFGRDLLELRRIEKTDNIYTALQVIGPEREDGTRLEVFVEDREALARWGRNGQHLVDVYEPITTDIEITEDRLRTLGEMELVKRINASVSFMGGIADLENVEGMGKKKIRFGDTIQLRDTSYDPHLYLEARIHTLHRDIVTLMVKHVELGDYVEFTEDEVKAIWKSLQADIRRKIDESERRNRLAIEDYAEPIIPEQPNPPDSTVHKKWVDTSVNPNQMKLWDDDLSAWTTVKGQDGVSSYLWTRYSANPNGSGFTGTPDSSTRYVGFATTTSPNAPRTASDYTWSKYVGEDGKNGTDGKDGIAHMGQNPPTNPDIDKVWFQTDFTGKVIAIKKWNGIKWEIAKMDAETLNVIKLSALSADLGEVNAGILRAVELIGATGTFLGMLLSGDPERLSSYVEIENGVITAAESEEPGSYVASIDDGGLTFGVFTTTGIRTLAYYSSNRIQTSDELVIQSPKIRFEGGEVIEFPNGPSLDMASGIARWRQSDSNYIMQRADGQIAFFMDGATRHVFKTDGTKTGGTIELDGEVLGMSPIDSPQILLSTLITDVQLQANVEKEIFLDEKFTKAMANMSVFPNLPVKIMKNKGKFTAISTEDCTVDFMIYGERIKYEGTYWVEN